MKQQVLVIRGGETFSKYNDYISYLKNREISLDNLKTKKGWKNRMETDLGEDFEVFLPEMPNKRNARYLEWKIWFEKIIDVSQTQLLILSLTLCK